MDITKLMNKYINGREEFTLPYEWFQIVYVGTPHSKSGAPLLQCSWMWATLGNLLPKVEYGKSWGVWQLYST